MKVKAVEKGYFNDQIVEPGDVFEIHDRKVVVSRNKRYACPKTGAIRRGALVKGKHLDPGQEYVITAKEQFSTGWMESLEQNEPRVSKK